MTARSNVSLRSGRLRVNGSGAAELFDRKKEKQTTEVQPVVSAGAATAPALRSSKRHPQRPRESSPGNTSSSGNNNNSNSNSTTTARRGRREANKPIVEQVPDIRPVKRQKVEDPPSKPQQQPSSSTERVKSILRSRQPSRFATSDDHRDRVSSSGVRIEPPLPSRLTRSSNHHASSFSKKEEVNIYPEENPQQQQQQQQQQELPEANHEKGKVNTVPQKAQQQLQQPPAIDKRTLRSQDGGARFKSELSQYFPNYDLLMSFEPLPKELLTADTQIVLIDDLPPPEPSKSQKLKSSSTDNKFSLLPHQDLPPSAAHRPPPDLLTNLHNARRIGLPPSIPTKPRYRTNNTIKDTLTSDIFFKAHRRAERQEKQLRNIEKERAQHEKVDLERILDQLRGPDWLKVFGVSGVTDSEKKKYEPKRRLFSKLVSGLIEKFRIWKEEDKRRKQEREAAMFAGDETEADPGAGGSEDEDEGDEVGGVGSSSHQPNGTGIPSSSPNYPLIDDPPPDLNDVDAWAARQLHQEAQAFKKPPNPKSVKSTTRNNAKPPSSIYSTAITRPLLPPEKEKPFNSFFSKPYMREAALGKARRGRNRHAFGHPIPDVEERDFELPEEYLTVEAIRASRRKRRRLMRGSRDGI